MSYQQFVDLSKLNSFFRQKYEATVLGKMLGNRDRVLAGENLKNESNNSSLNSDFKPDFSGLLRKQLD
jgi:hypothetical protein